MLSHGYGTESILFLKGNVTFRHLSVERVLAANRHTQCYLPNLFITIYLLLYDIHNYIIMIH